MLKKCTKGRTEFEISRRPCKIILEILMFDSFLLLCDSILCLIEAGWLNRQAQIKVDIYIQTHVTHTLEKEVPHVALSYLFSA